ALDPPTAPSATDSSGHISSFLSQTELSASMTSAGNGVRDPLRVLGGLDVGHDELEHEADRDDPQRRDDPAEEDRQDQGQHAEARSVGEVARGGTGRNARADAGDDRTEVGQHGDDDRDDVDEARPLDGDEIVEAEVEQRFEEALLAGLGLTVSGLRIALWVAGAGLRIGTGLRVGSRRLRVGTGLAVAVSLGVGAGLAVADVLRCLTLAVAALISALLIGTCLVGTRLISGIGVRVIGALLVAGLGCLLLIGLLPRSLFLRGLFLCGLFLRGLLPCGLLLCGLLVRGLLLRCRLILAVVAAARVLVVGRVLILGVTVVRFVRVLRCRHDRPLAFGMQSLAICLYPQLIRAPFDEEDRLSSWKQTRSDGSACAVGQQRDAPLNGKSPAGFDNVEIVSLRPGGEGIR